MITFGPVGTPLVPGIGIKVIAITKIEEMKVPIQSKKSANPNLIVTKRKKMRSGSIINIILLIKI